MTTYAHLYLLLMLKPSISSFASVLSTVAKWINYATISIWSGHGTCFLFGVVLMVIYVSTYEYIIDSYQEHAAVTLAFITMAGRLFGLRRHLLATRPMYEGIMCTG
jgi:hypothetical protein